MSYLRACLEVGRANYIFTDWLLVRKNILLLWNIFTLTITLFSEYIIILHKRREKEYEGREKEGQEEEKEGERKGSRERCQLTLQQKLGSACHLSLSEDVSISCSEEMLEISALKVEWNVQKALSASVKIQIFLLGLLSNFQYKRKCNDFLFYLFKVI